MNSIQRLAVLVPTLFLVPLASAQRHKLNGPLATAYTTDVSSFDLAHGRILFNQSGDLFTASLGGGTPGSLVYHQEPEEQHDYGHSARLTPNGQRIVMIDDLDATHVLELFSFAADGSSAPLKLNAPLGTGLHVLDSRLSSDGLFVVYQVGASVGSAGALYSARVDGSEPAVALGGSGPIGRCEISADSSRVLFLAENERLYTVPIDGSAPPVSVHQPLGGVPAVTQFALAPVGGRVVYRVGQPGFAGVYSAPVDASAPQVKLNVNGGVSHFEIAFDSAYVTYVGDEELDGIAGLYAAPIAGGPYTRFVVGEPGLTILSERISPDRSRMVYRAQHPGRVDLYSVPTDGSAPPLNLTAALPGGDVGDFLVDPVSGRIAFGVYTGSGFALYGAANDGTTPPVRLSAPGAVIGVQAGRVQIAAGSRVVFLTDNAAHQTFELYSAPLDGSSPAVRLHPPLVAGGRVYSFVLDGTRTQAVYRAEQDFEDVLELFSVPVDGSAPPTVRSATRVSVTVGDVDSFVATPNGARVVYRASEAAGTGLYAIAPGGSSTRVELGSGKQIFQLTPDSQRVVYVDEYYALVSARLDGMWPPPTAITTGGFLDSLGWRISPDSSRVVYVHQADFYSEPNRLFSTRVDGGAPSVELNVPRAISDTAGSVKRIVISPDSSRVVYAGVQDTQGVDELYSAPLAGGAAPVKLSGVLVAGGDVRLGEPDLTISADSSRAVYLADRDVNDSFELYSVPIAGGPPAVELSALPAADRDVLSFAVSPDSARVVYVADQDSNDVYELYSVPLAGGAAPIELSNVARPDEDVSYGFAPRISPDSQWVVYRANHEQQDLLELYRVPITGGAAPVRLTVGGTSELLALTADGASVLYAAPIAGGTGLFRVASSGGPAVLLSGELDLGWPPWSPSGPANQAPRVSVDASGRWVLFNAASPHVSGVDEPFVAPMDGRSEPVPVCAPLAGVTPSNVLGVFRPGGSTVLYMAEQDEPGVVELYHALPKRAPGFVRPR